MDYNLAPCADDYNRTKRDWTAEYPKGGRAEAEELAQMCQTCPLRKECFDNAKADRLNVSGVWGGYFWRRGRAIDVLNEPTKSIYFRVHYDSWRERWRTEREVDGKRKRGGYHDTEDEAGAASMAFQGD